MRRMISVVAGLLLLAGCSGSPTPAPQAPPELPRAAEPATAPPTAVTPAGRVVPIGPAPEGAVADPQTHLVAVGVRAPDSLALLDGRTGTITKKIPLPGNLRHLQLEGPGGPVLVPDESSGKLLTITLPAGEVAAQVMTGVVPHDATRAANGSIFVGNELGKSVVVVRDNRIVHTFTDVTQPAGLAPVGNLVGLIDVRQNDLTLYDADTFAQLGRVPAGAGPTHLLADNRGHFAVADTRGNAILVYEATPQLRQIGRLDLPGTPYGITYDSGRDRMWVTLTATNEVVGLDLSTGTPREVARFPTPRQPNTVAVDSATGRVFVTGLNDGVLQLIDP